MASLKRVSTFSIDRGQLIDLVRERPAIWDKNSPLYKIKSARNEAWREICSILNDDYDEKLNHSDKVEYYMAVVRAWTVTRDGWVRSLKKGQPSYRPYCFHNKLLFLQDVINPQFNTSTEYLNDTKYENVEYLYPDSDDDTKSDDSDEVEEKPDISKLFDKRQKPKRRISTDALSDSNDGYQDKKGLKRKRFKSLNEYNQNRNDEVLVPLSDFEDRHLCFFKSIQPTLATLDEGEVLEFQSGVISLLQSIRSRHSNE
ncbi:uncharacterized protein LOC128682082 [Plodia interpunctella]|uniref:uncharacterized protein LOC128682082 n=1 Tax=Plodia interpunctella TaxID=58824 RepID=UPI002367C157|nr:uncharacterized protein LOC128682082 [Plodia interpunctella]